MESLRDLINEGRFDPLLNLMVRHFTRDEFSRHRLSKLAQEVGEAREAKDRERFIQKLKERERFLLHLVRKIERLAEDER